MLKRIQLRNEDQGVSEVLGSILTLIVTVTLFSSIFIGVQSLQPPDKGNHYDFSTILEESNGNYYLNITNIGGEELTSESSINLVNEDGLTKTFSLTGNDFKDGEWNLGDTLHLVPDPGYITNSENVELVIIDKKSSRVVWEDMLKTGDVLPPIIQDYGVKYPLEWDKYAIAGDKVTLWADVIDRDTTNDLNITVNLTKLNGYTGSESLNTTNYKQKETNTYRYTLALTDNQPNGTYLLKINATDKNGNKNQESYYFVLHVGKYTKIEPADIRVNANKFQFSSRSPRNGEEFGITSIIYNDGGTRATADIQFWDQYPNGTRKLMETKKNISFPIGGGREVSSNWIARGSGTHRITVNATNVSYGIGGEGSKNITVSPTILVVDDEGTSTETRSEATSMVNALQASDFEYDLARVRGKDGPDYDSGPTPLEDYDIIIWMTGSKSSNTLSETDQDNLDKVLNDGKKLWLIGDGIEDSSASGWVKTNFKMSFSNLEEKPESPLNGTGILFDQDDEFHLNRSMAGKVNAVEGVYGGNNSLGNETRNYVVSYKSDEPGGKRTVFQSFLFSSLNETITGSRSRLAYKVIMWLGNISKKSGKDLAISSQEIDDFSPNYMETVKISATVRNNGQQPEETEVVLEEDGVIVNKTQIIIGGEDTRGVNFNWEADELGKHSLRIIVDPFNTIEETNEMNNDILYQGEVKDVDVKFTTLIVDDDGSGENDDSTNSTKYIEKAYGRLGYTYDSYYKKDESISLRKMRNYSSICWVGINGNGIFDESKEVIKTYLNEYSSNFVLIGNGLLEGDYDSFRENIMGIDYRTTHDFNPHYLEGVKNDPITNGFEYYLNDSNLDQPDSYGLSDKANPIFQYSSNTYAHRYENRGSDYKMVYLGIDPIYFKQACKSSEEEWYEEYDMNINGSYMREELIFSINSWFGMNDERVELRVSDIGVEISSQHPTLIMGSSFVIRANIQNLGGTGANALIRFKDDNTHIATESLYIPADGNQTLEVKWKPVNAGEKRPIRVIVDPLKEIGEIPNIVGKNTKKDHLGFNNQAVIYTDVFYFWDDMENGTGNWRHETSLANINGEVPLDYMGGQYDSLDTDIASGWKSNESVKKVSWDSHSEPNSYLMEETKGKIEGGGDVLISFVIDDSASMDERNWLDDAKDAAKTLLDQLSNDSKCVSIWDFMQNDARQYYGPNDPPHLDSNVNLGSNDEIVRLGDNYNGEDGRSKIRSEIEDMVNSNGKTILWDAIGGAYEDISYYSSYYPNLDPVVVVLSDGADIQASDRGSIQYQKLEAGSDTWCPWGKMKNGFQEWGNSQGGDTPLHYGKYTLDWSNPEQNTEWIETGTYGGSIEHDRKGLLSSELPIYTVGLGVEHHDPPNLPKISSYPGQEVVDYTNAYYTGTDPSAPYYPDYKDVYNESGTLEYNLWRIATTSNAKYFHAPDNSELNDVFAEIGQLLAKPGNLSSTNSDNNEIKSWNNPNPKEKENKDKWAITPEIDIYNMTSAYLTFWHKYKILNGVNGAYIELNYTINGNWQGWNYTKPSIGPYSGNLYMKGELPTDSDGDKIRWCWNGRSADGTLDWEYVKVDLFRHIPDNAEQLKIRFYYKQYGGSNEPGGWLIDDVNIMGSRKGNDYYQVTDGQMDVWHYVRENDGNKAWWNGINYNTLSEQRFRGGIDNRLVSTGIDLSNARNATLSADFKFNINNKSGRPPDGFRVEITSDNGKTWESINLGSRAASGYSDGWVKADDLNRLLVDLTDFAGETIMIRFRVVTNNVQNHYEKNPATSAADYGGFYLDNVVISGETL